MATATERLIVVQTNGNAGRHVLERTSSPADVAGETRNQGQASTANVLAAQSQMAMPERFPRRFVLRPTWFRNMDSASALLMSGISIPMGTESLRNLILHSWHRTSQRPSASARS
jgi:hypothetical protein